MRWTPAGAAVARRMRLRASWQQKKADLVRSQARGLTEILEAGEGRACYLEVVVPELHLSPLTPKGGEVVNVLVVHRTALLKDDARILQVAVLLVELCKGSPERVRLADRLFCQPKRR